MKLSPSCVFALYILQSPICALGKNVWKAPSSLAPAEPQAAQQQVHDGTIAARGLESLHNTDEQLPIVIHSASESQSASPKSGDEGQGAEVILPDVLGKERELNIFASLTRYVPAVSARLSNPELNTTVLAPKNDALQRLSHKPWESRRDYLEYGQQAAYAGREGGERAAGNLRQFVEGHVVPVSPWKEGQAVVTLAGQRVWWELRGDDIYVSEMMAKND
ncbi:hypothetical protein KEM52_006146 [Ascosphaera acerosa]|nr:hypothetical protein KEM52_006146 [Ascosphaera acerosa]